jgi:hypothetical protein
MHQEGPKKEREEESQHIGAEGENPWWTGKWPREKSPWDGEMLQF